MLRNFPSNQVETIYTKLLLVKNGGTGEGKLAR
jgi:hypothetical protein